MRKQRTRGISALEFAFSGLVLIPLLLGTGVTGVNMIKNLQATQLARDAGHMYARGVDFSQSGNETVLAGLGANLGLSTSSTSSKAVVILSKLTYVDKNICAAVGAADASGNPTSACTNYTYWVFTQRWTVGKPSVRASNYGSPLTSGPTGVALDAKGNISMSDYAKKSGARATFSGVNPYSVVAGQGQGLPSGQMLYVAEAAGPGFSMPPFVYNAVAYSWGIF